MQLLAPDVPLWANGGKSRPRDRVGAYGLPAFSLTPAVASLVPEVAYRGAR
ncbi:hypothetical protein [Streptomyces sp. NPDC058394]|uniref:hypothetical protein n=1 Tax=Streptomyces sp. NPDC058394 TaxID=3346477 RepID=UPI00365B6379